jgi:hypothetical protein
MLTFTLDTNCIIDLAEPAKRPAARHIRSLANAHADGVVDVALVAVSASERQQGDTYLESYTVFKQRVDTLGLSHIPILPAMGYYDISFWDMCLRADDKMEAREKEIHAVLFPNIQFAWPDYAQAYNLSVDDTSSPKARRWRNAFCDRQMFWAHDHNKRGFFVTSDAGFRKIDRHPAFPNSQVVSPELAVGLF